MSRTLHVLHLGLFTLFSLAPLVHGAPSAADAANPEAAHWADQLADPEPSARLKAAWKLREIGLPALPVLGERATSSDPEVKLAAVLAIRAIGGPLPEVGEGPRFFKTIRADDDYWIIDYHEGQRIVRMEGDTCKFQQPYRHLKLSFTGRLDGKKVTQTFEGTSDEDLKWNAPQAWAVFHSIFNHDSEMASVQVVRRPLVHAVKAAMDKASFSPEKRKEVNNHVHRYIDACSKAMASIMLEPETAPDRLAEEFHQSDSLRQYLQKNKLPVIEDQLDPPPELRLGVYFLPSSGNNANQPIGATILFSAPGERADRVGLKAGDVIQTINGTSIADAEDIQSILTAHPTNLVVEIIRDRIHLTVREK